MRFTFREIEAFPGSRTMERRAGCDTIVVVPCYNEARRLDLRGFSNFLDDCAEASLLFVDDGSTDATTELLESFVERCPEKVTVLQLGRNSGKGEAVRQGVLAAWLQSPTFVGYWDADLATPLNAVSQFRNLLVRRPELTLVMGSRIALLGRQIKRRWVRHMAGRAFATAASMTLGLAVYDTQCGAKLFRATHETQSLFQRPFGSRWIFDVEILARLVAAAGVEQAEQMIFECPLDRWTDVGGSQLKPRDFARAAVDLARIYCLDCRYPDARIAPTLPTEQPTRQREAA
jgi:dolichyl-phosphate beta-glucosyltransferase